MRIVFHPKTLELAALTIAVLLLAACSGLNSEGAREPAPALPAPATAMTPATPRAAPGTAAGSVSTQEAGSTVAATAPVATTVSAATSMPPVTPVPAAGLATAPGATSTSLPAASTPAEATAANSQGPAVACTPGAITPAQTEGPYYKANPPARSSLLNPDTYGTKLTVEGYVFDAGCRPIPGARVDVWQADSSGQYDNSGYNLRGYEVTDAQGRYMVDTVVPGLYPGRTRHIHVKITPPNGPTLTTQLYFPGEAANSRDSIFSPQMVLQIQKTASGEVGMFNFVVNAK